MNNDYANYLNLESNTQEKFLKGLDVMVLGSNFLYHEAKINSARKFIKQNEQILNHYRLKKKQIDEKFNIKINLVPLIIILQ